MRNSLAKMTAVTMVAGLAVLGGAGAASAHPCEHKGGQVVVAGDDNDNNDGGFQFVIDGDHNKNNGGGSQVVVAGDDNDNGGMMKSDEDEDCM